MSDPANTPPGDYEAATRYVAGLALGEAMAARIVQFEVLTYLVTLGIMPRERAVEMLDAAILRMEELRARTIPGAADCACKRLRELMEWIASGNTGTMPETLPWK